MGIMVITTYRPRPGGEMKLRDLIRAHVPKLRRLGFATERPALVMKTGDGVYVEVFEWVSREAIDDAHENIEVAQMWEWFQDVCEYESLSKLPECQGQFAHFEPVDLD